LPIIANVSCYVSNYPSAEKELCEFWGTPTWMRRRGSCKVTTQLASNFRCGGFGFIFSISEKHGIAASGKSQLQSWQCDIWDHIEKKTPDIILQWDNIRKDRTTPSASSTARRAAAPSTLPSGKLVVWRQ
jgi:hypothetical protein